MCHKELVSLIFPVLRCDIQSLHVHYSMLLQLFFPVLCTQVNLELQLSKNHLDRFWGWFSLGEFRARLEHKKSCLEQLNPKLFGHLSRMCTRSAWVSFAQ